MAVWALIGDGGRRRRRTGGARAGRGGAVRRRRRLRRSALGGAGLRACCRRQTGAGGAARRSASRQADIADYERLRIRLGLPDGSRDMLVEKSLLLECGFDELNGIDWQKGCYLGQELTARTRYRGLVKKRLLPVRVEGPLPPPGTPILLDGKEVGEVRSGVDGWALALLRLDALPAIRAAGGVVVGAARLLPEPPAWAVLPADVAITETP